MTEALCPAAALQQIAAGRTPAGERLTLRQLATGYLSWLEMRKHPPTTLQSYGDALGAFLTFAAGIGLEYEADVSVLTLDGFFYWLHSRGAKPASMAHRRSVLISWWAWMEHEGFAPHNTARKTFPIKTGRRLPKYLEPHQIDTLMEKLAALPDLRGRRDHALVATFFLTGLRVSELAALRVVDVDLIARRIRVNQGKGSRDRVNVIPGRLLPILTAYVTDVRPRIVGGLPYPWLFPQTARSMGAGRLRAGKPWLTRSIHYTIRGRAQEILGVKLGPHGLRHTAATYLLYHGAQLETVQRLLGHQDVRTTMIYTHVPQKRQEEEIDRIFGKGDA